MYFKKFLTFFILLIYFQSAYSDDRSNARGTGLGFASMVSSFGINSYGINPGNYDHHNFKLKSDSLKLNSSKKNQFQNRAWEFSIMSVGGGYGSDSSLDFYNNYLKYLSINRNTFTGLFSDINQVLDFRQNVLPGKRTDVIYDFELKWFSANYTNLKIGAFNFTISDKVGLNTNVLSRDEYLPLNFLYTPHGSSYDLTNVSLNQSEATAWWLRKYSIGYAKQFDFKGVIRSLSIGFSAGLVNGFGNIITEDSKLNVNTYGITSTPSGNHVDSIKGKQEFYTKAALTDFFRDYIDGAQSHFTFFPKPAGTGYSFDFGFNMQIGSSIRIAASITELGKVTWDYNTFINNDTNSFVYRNFTLNSSDPTYNAFVNDLEGLDSRDTINSYDTDMPTKYRAGVQFQPSDKFSVELDWVKGKNNLPGNSDKDIYSLGSEYYILPQIPVRAGLSIGGPEDFNIALGFGLKLNNFTMDFGSNGINQIIANKRLSLAISAKLLL